MGPLPTAAPAARRSPPGGCGAARPPAPRACPTPELAPPAAAAAPPEPPLAARRRLLAASLALPPLLLLRPAVAAAPAARGPRLLTPDERAAVDAALDAALPRARAPVALRLVFHDAATYSAAAGDGGLNASVRFELGRPENAGLKRGWAVVEAAAAALARTPAAAAVSLADLVALAGARAVALTGGPAIDVPVGRADAAGPDPGGRLPAETLSAAGQRAAFAAMGLSPAEMVALLGAHTIGGKGFGDGLVFDNAYYAALLARPWESKQEPMAEMIGLPSDHALAGDAAARAQVERYAADQAAFFADFAAAYLRLTSLGAAWV